MFNSEFFLTSQKCYQLELTDFGYIALRIKVLRIAEKICTVLRFDLIKSDRGKQKL